MKKTYIIPTTEQFNIGTKQGILLEGSLNVNDNSGTGTATFYQQDATGAAMTKGDRVSRESYNVWDDDWSK